MEFYRHKLPCCRFTKEVTLICINQVIYIESLYKYMDTKISNEACTLFTMNCHKNNWKAIEQYENVPNVKFMI